MHNNKKKVLLTLLIIATLTIITINIISGIIFKNNGGGNLIVYDDNVLYDGKKLLYPAKKRILYNKTVAAVDCNSNLIECAVNNDCEKKCIQLKHHESECLTGLCRYVKKDFKTFCQNEGQITSTFRYGRFFMACICPENFIGFNCQIPNEMKSSYLRTFELSY